MPNQPRPDNPGRRFRCEDVLWRAFQAATAAEGTKPSRELRLFVQSYVLKHEAKAGGNPRHLGSIDSTPSPDATCSPRNTDRFDSVEGLAATQQFKDDRVNMLVEALGDRLMRLTDSERRRAISEIMRGYVIGGH